MPESDEPEESFVASIAALGLHLVVVAGMGVVCWQAGYGGLQIGIALGGAAIAAMPLVIGIVGWAHMRRPGRRISRPRRVGTWARVALLALGLALLAAVFVAVGVLVPPT